MQLKFAIALSAMMLSTACFAAIDCSVSTTPFGFGNFDPDGSSVDAENGLVRVTCFVIGSEPTPKNLSYVITLSPGLAGSYTTRKLSRPPGGPGNTISYNVYVASSRLPTQVWGDGLTGGTVAVPGAVLNLSNANTSGSNDHIVYGRLPGPQSGVNPGVYQDSLFITVTY
jgi:spore coat protein U-like protein